jgi:hypothetical protein
MMGAIFVFLDLEVHITGTSSTRTYYSQRAVCRVLILFCIRGRKWTVKFTYLLQGRAAILFSAAENRLCTLRCSQQLLDLASVFIARSWRR